MPSKRLLLSFALLLLQLTNFVHGAKKDIQVLSPEVVEAAVAAEDSALMGKMFPIVSKLFMRSKGGFSFHQVFKAVADLVDEREFAIFAMAGWLLVPVTQAIYQIIQHATAKGLGTQDDEEEVVDETKKSSKLGEAYEHTSPWDKKSRSTSEVTGGEKRGMFPFKDTVTFQVVDLISQASKIGLSVIVVDCVSLISRMMGYNPWNILENASRIFSKVVTTGWITFRLCDLKRFLLGKAIGSDLGKMNVIDNLANGVFHLVWMFYLLNYLEVETGVAIKSLFSVGATGTLVFGLASKDIASQILGGLTLHLSDKIFEGDDVRFSDGTSGKIEKVGWFETMIRNSDELVVGIPNTELSGQRVYNLSRTPRSHVKQELRISYDDARKIPKLLESIKEEIKRDCPKLIADGSRPFRAHWQNYEDDHLQIVVNCHFTIKPTGSEYWDNRQKMLEAIYRAAEKTGVHFVTAV